MCCSGVVVVLCGGGVVLWLLQHEDEMSMKVILNGKYIARVIEGCNSVSIIILFLAFIVAFKGSLKNTIIFGVVGAMIIYIVNILRIAFLIHFFHY